LKKGRCEKIQIKKATASVVVQGAGKICLPKSAGHLLPPMGSPEFAKERPQTRVTLSKYNMIFIWAGMSLVPRGQRRNHCLFWQANFSRPLDTVPLPISRSLNFFTASGGLRGISGGSLFALRIHPFFLRKSASQFFYSRLSRNTPGGQSPNDIFLHHQSQEQDRQGDNRSRGTQRPPADGLITQEVKDGYRQGLRSLARQNHRE
jgi:hypothetical protein